MGVDERDLQVMDVEMTVGNFPIPTHLRYVHPTYM